jgi:hypothetical protein
VAKLFHQSSHSLEQLIASQNGGLHMNAEELPNFQIFGRPIAKFRNVPVSAKQYIFLY